jgi:hypothetical protein
MKKFAMISSVLAVALALALEGNFFHRILLVSGMMYLLAPSLLGLMIVAIRARFHPEDGSLFHTVATIVGIVGAALLISWTLGLGMHHWREHQTRMFVARAVDYLDAERARSGTYPLTLPLAQIGSPPKWLRGAIPWTLKPDSFAFWYSDPSGMMDGCTFASDTRTWIHSD